MGMLASSIISNGLALLIFNSCYRFQGKINSHKILLKVLPCKYLNIMYETQKLVTALSFNVNSNFMYFYWKSW